MQPMCQAPDASKTAIKIGAWARNCKGALQSTEGEDSVFAAIRYPNYAEGTLRARR